jgi:ADP-ribosylglycohydrolase
LKGLSNLLGCIIGDIVGSIYEFDNIKEKDFPFFQEECEFTDDTIISIAIADALMEYKRNGKDFKEECINKMKYWGNKYPNLSYGDSFDRWLKTDTREPYNSFGNGSAMRVSAIGELSNSLEECLQLAQISAEVTHNHPEGIKGAVVTAGCIYLAKQKNKEIIKDFVSKYYNLNFDVDVLRYIYDFDETCQGSVPQAIKCFLESNSFEDTIRTTISIGGDSDTLAAISGSIAEIFYGIPENIKQETNKFLNDEIREFLNEYNKMLQQ